MLNLTWVRGSGCPAAVAASIMAAYCSGDGRYEGMGSLFGRFVGGGATAAAIKINSLILSIHTAIIKTYDPFRSFHKRVVYPMAAEELR